MYTISDGTTTLVPTLVLDYSTARASRSIVHDTLGSSSPDVTLRPPSTRDGVLHIFCLTRADAQALEALHLTALPMTFTDPEAPPMTYVITGTLIVTYLVDVNRWRVDISYREVAA